MWLVDTVSLWLIASNFYNVKHDVRSKEMGKRNCSMWGEMPVQVDRSESVHTL